MANRKISDLTALTAPVTGDLLPIVDISEAAAADKNKKITYGTFLSSVPLGTAAAPSIAFTGDPNTGIYSPGADQLAISTSGTGRLLVDASGKLGVNMTPASGTVVDILAANNTSLSPTLRVNSNNLAVNSSLAYDGLSGSGQVTIQAGASSALIFGANAGEKMRILSGGNVGIGTSLPGAKLEVAGSDAAPNGVGDFALSYASSKRLVFGDTGSPTFCSWIQSTQTLGGAFWPLALNPSGGNVGIGNTGPAATLHVDATGGATVRVSRISASAGAYGQLEHDGTNTTLTSTAATVFVNNSSEKARIDTSGRLLVGTSSASGANLLQVNSDALVNGLTVGRGASNDSNTAVLGNGALAAETGGTGNVAIGRQAVNSLTTGSYNIGVGYLALSSIVSNSGSIMIGGVTSAGSYSPASNITASNRISIGSTSVTDAFIQVAWTVVSDARDKTNFSPVPHGLDFVTALKPTAFQFKLDRESSQPNGRVRYGFKAQDILELEGENGIIINSENPEKLYYNGESLIPVLVNAIKELSAKNTALEARLTAAGID
jgi:hypothetical protein